MFHFPTLPFFIIEVWYQREMTLFLEGTFTKKKEGERNFPPFNNQPCDEWFPIQNMYKDLRLVFKRLRLPLNIKSVRGTYGPLYTFCN